MAKKSSLKTVSAFLVLAVFVFTNFLPGRAWAEDMDVSTGQSEITSVVDEGVSSVSDQVASTEVTVESTEITPVADAVEDVTSAPEDTILTDEAVITPVDDKKIKDDVPIKQDSKMLSPAAATRGSAAQPVTSKSLKLQPNQNNGALVFVYPLTVAPGRNGLQPDLKLSYNSQNKDEDNIFGYGWNLNIPYIERINKNGADKLYNQDYFSSSLSGELISTSSGVYAAKVENGDFLNYSFSNNQWLVKDKSGRQYKFGYASDGRLDDPGDSSRVYRWFLEEIRDTNDNYIKYTYYKDGGQIYPSQIVYTGHDATDGIFTVNFERSSRADINKSYKSTFLVTTNYRISEINVAVDSSWVRKYSLSYTVGDNSYRSLLNSVTESARDIDLNETSLPATVFSYQSSTSSWTHSDNTYAMPVTSDGKQSVLTDVSGDGLPDVVQSYENATSTYKNTWQKNTSSDWSLNSNLEPPTLISKLETRDGDKEDLWDQGTRLADVNGDLLPDSIQGLDQYQGAGTYVSYLNSTSTGFVQNYDWVSPVGLSQAPDGGGNGGSTEDYGANIIDLNGDGLADVTRQWSDNYQDTYLNTGSNFATSTSTWNTPVDLRSPWTQSTDLNNDGLPDLVYSYWNSNLSTYEERSYLNDGTGIWTTSTEFVTPKNFVDDSNADLGVRFIDINGDNLPDAVWDSVSADRSWINTGNGWSESTSWTLPFAAGDLLDEKIFVGDINGDGLVDFIKSANCDPGYNCQNTDTYIHDGVVPDLLSSVTYPQGGSSVIGYQKSTQYKDENSNLLNPKLPLSVDTVSLIADNDGLGQIATTTYAYADGSYYFNNPFDRQFAGFGKIIKTRPDNTTETSYYHQGNETATSSYEFDDQYAKIGKAYQVDNRDASGNLYQSAVTKWQVDTLSADHYFVYPAQTISQQYDGNTTHSDTAITYEYDDSTGNLLEQNEWGIVTTTNPLSFTDAGTDNRSTIYTYASNSETNVSVPASITLLDSDDNKTKETKYYYDNLSSGQVSEGNNTGIDSWIAGATYSASSKIYNSYGLVTSETDPRSNVTAYNYDSYNLYPIIITKPLNMVSGYVYDYTSGQPTQITDENNQIFKYSYDGFGRLLSEQIPNEDYAREILNTSFYDDPSLKAYYQLEGNVNDSKGNNNGWNYLVNYSADNGRFGQGANLTYPKSSIDHNDVVNWNSTLTYNLWVKPTGSGTLISKYSANNSGILSMSSRIDYDEKTITWDYYNGNWSYLKTPIDSVIPDEWNMLTLTRDENGMRTIYVNGVEKASGATGDLLISSTSPIGISDIADDDAKYFLGNVDDIAIFDRNLSAAEIANLYNGGLAPDIPAVLDTGFKDPTSTSYGDWTDPENALVEDDNFATITINNPYNGQSYEGFDFGVPSEWLNVTGIEVQVKAKVDGGTNNKLKVSAAYSQKEITNLTANSTWHSIGGPTDLWGQSQVSLYYYLLDGIPNVVLTADGNASTTFSVDAIKIKVYYTVSVGHDSGIKVPTNYGTYSSGWADPTNAYEEDENFASVGLDISETTSQSYENFNLNIPATSTIVGIQVSIKGSLSFGSGSSSYLELDSTNNGGKQIVVATLDGMTETQKIGNYFSSLGEEWEPADFNDNKFYIRINSENYDFDHLDYYLDYVGVKIYYTFPGQNYEPTASATTTPFVTKRSITYNDIPNLSSHELAYSHVSSTDPGADEYVLYDGLGRPVRNIKSQNSSALYADTEYDSLGRISRQSLPYGQSSFSSAYNGYGAGSGITTSYNYDSLGRMTTASDANGATTNVYNGNIMTVTDYEDNTKSYKRDGLNRLVQVTENNQNNTYHTYYDWNAQDNLVKITDAEDNERNFAYDGLGRRISAEDLHDATDQSFGTYSYEYDNSGNLIEVTTPKNDIIIYDYDALNRQTSERLSGDSQPRISYDYDGCVNGQGKLCAVGRDDGPGYVYTYNNNGQVATEAITINNWYKTTAYQYDRQGNIKKITLPDNSEVRYNYADGNPYNQPTSIVWKTALATTTTPIINNITYNETGQPKTIEYANGRTSNYSYDDSHKYRLNNIITDAPSGNYQDVGYTWTPAGNLSSIAETGNAGLARTVDYSYDNLYRLTEAIAQASSTTIYDQTIAYSPTGNILSKSDQGSYAYSSANNANPQAVTQIGTSTLAYDDNGNLTDYNSNSYGWDYRNELKDTVIGTATTSYLYSHNGDRTQYYTPDRTVYYPNKYYEYDVVADKATTHIYLLGQPIANIEVVGTSSPVIHYIHRDHLGGTALITDNSGNLAQALDYYPFGNTRDTAVGSYQTGKTFTGHTYDPETDLLYMGARYYKGALGRFFSEDQLVNDIGIDNNLFKQKYNKNLSEVLSDPQSLNSYSYVSNNPLIYIDKTGEFKLNTLGVGAFQVLESCVDTVATVVQAGAAGGAYALGRPDAGTVLFAGALGNLDNAFAGSANATANIIGSFKDNSPTRVMNQGPIRDEIKDIMGDTTLFDRVALSGDVLAFTAKDIPRFVSKTKSAYNIYQNAKLAGVGGASLRYLTANATKMTLEIINQITQIATGKGVFDHIDQKLTSVNNKKK